MFLEIPFHTEAWINSEAVVDGEVIGDFYFCPHVQVVTAQVAADVVPELRFSNEGGRLGKGVIDVIVLKCEMVLPPQVGKT